MALAALVFVGVAVGSIIAPQIMAQPLGLRLDNVNALNEARAIYVGLWLAHAVILVLACLRPQTRLLGDVGAILILGQTAGRIISVALDGMPGVDLLPIAIGEGVGGLAIALVR
jgi:hypothetical protein